MKKALITFALLMVTLNSIAQTKDKKEMLWGVNLGTNINLFNQEKYLNEKGLAPGLLIGINFETPINEKWLFKTGVNFVTKRNKADKSFTNINTNESGSFTKTVNQRNISIPLLLKHNIKQSGFYLNVGTVFYYQFNEKISLKGDISSSDTINETVLDTGLSFGIGKKVKISANDYLNIELRNDLDVLTLQNKEYNIKTNILNFMVTYNLN